MGFNYLFIFPPSYVALWVSKARHRLASESVSWCLETSLSFKTPFPGQISFPTSFVSLFIFYSLSYLLLKTMGCLSGCLESFASIQKLFCGICSEFKWSFDEICGEESGLLILFLCHLRIVPPQFFILWSLLYRGLRWNFEVYYVVTTMRKPQTNNYNYNYQCNQPSSVACLISICNALKQVF